MYSLVVVDIGKNRQSQVLVARPPHYSGLGTIDATSCFRIVYLENVFVEILSTHGSDHVKGRTLYVRMCEHIENIPHPVCKIFTDTCPRCLERLQQMKPIAGLRPIITQGFGTRGQVNLIDFQSMPDGDFCFL